MSERARSGLTATDLQTPRDDPSEFQARLAARLRTITIELGTPRLHDDRDTARYLRQVQAYQELLDEGWIDGVTVRDAPDLGRLKTWLVRRALVPLSHRVPLPFSEVMREVDLFVDVRDLHPSPPAFVATIAAQDRSRRELENHMLNAVERHHARALFLVGGGHPYRKVAWARRFMPMDTVKLLDLAHSLQREGRLPTTLPLWASWDPYHEPDRGSGLDGLQAKIDHGASAILTQPPFLRAPFERWLEVARHRGLVDAAQFKIGVPIITSSRNLIFWYQLVGIDPALAEARAAIDNWHQAEASGNERQFTLDWNAELIRWACSVAGTTGLHVMPVYGWRHARDVLTHAGLTPSSGIGESLTTSLSSSGSGS